MLALGGIIPDGVEETLSLCIECKWRLFTPGRVCVSVTHFLSLYSLYLAVCRAPCLQVHATEEAEQQRGAAFEQSAEVVTGERSALSPLLVNVLWPRRNGCPRRDEAPHDCLEAS